MTFAQKLNTYRTSNKLTQKQVVAKLSIDETFASLTILSYHRWEAGKTSPSIKKQAKVWFLLNEKRNLRQLSESNKHGLPDLKRALTERWDCRQFGVDNLYDASSDQTLTFKKVDLLENVPSQAFKAHNTIYSTTDDDMSDYKNLVKTSSHSLILLAYKNTAIAGQMALQVTNVDTLTHHLHLLDQIKNTTVNKLESLELSSDEDIIFLSSFHCTQQQIYIYFANAFIEEILQLEKMPRITYVRVYGDIQNKLIISLLEPKLIDMGTQELARVKHGNKAYSWLGYAIPTHLLLLNHGALLAIIPSNEKIQSEVNKYRL